MADEHQDTAAKTSQPSSKNGEESFNEEIKDYAKTTMNELLGMFGYDDEITSESVNNLEIKVPSTTEESSTVNTVNNTVPTVAMAAMSNTNTLSMPVNIPDDSSDDVPVIVKVEGNTSVSDIIRKQNGHASTASVATTAQVTLTNQTNVTTSQPQTTQSTPMNITMTTESQTGQPSLGKKVITGLTRPQTTSAVNSTVSTPVSNETADGNAISSSLAMYLKSTIQSQAVRPCTWCKKSTVLKNFTFRDGTRILECRNICSQDCFEMAALSIDLNNDNIKSIQWRIKQLRGKAKPKAQPSQVKKPEPAVAARPARRTKPVAGQVARPFFDWEGYLKECGAKGAPGKFFKQSSAPPHNGFQPGMKLEVADPRVIQSTCLATVVGSIGPRIRVSFDGTDKSNDVWHMVDSADIHPVGWSEANNCQLQPPVGFTRDPGTYQKFVATILTTTDTNKRAPPRLFKKDPVTPIKNFFKTGMKLEAVDPKNQALVCVATVGGVDEDKIRIDFDGYLGSDYWCRYDSRNIFPVGWCVINNHPLQPPGKKKRPTVATTNKNKKEEEPPAKKHKPHTSQPPSSNKTPSLPESTNQSTDLSSPRAQPKISLYINHGCVTGRYLKKSRVAKMKPEWFGKCSEIIQPLIQGLVNCAHDQKTVFGFLKPGTGKTRITAHGKGGYETLSCSLQNIDRVKIFWKVLEKLLENLQCCENLVSGVKIQGSCKKCRGKSAGAANYVKRQKSSDNDVSSNQICSTSHVKTWSVDEVIRYIENTELSDHVSLFRVHEIDGRALLLLNRDMIMSYMGLKLGPAIKLLSIVEDLKPEEIVVD